MFAPRRRLLSTLKSAVAEADVAIRDFPDVKSANSFIAAGNAGAAEQHLKRAVGVFSGMGPANPLVVAARRRSVSPIVPFTAHRMLAAV